MIGLLVFLLPLTTGIASYMAFLNPEILKAVHEVKKVKWCIYITPLSQTSQRRFTMINLPPADRKHIEAQMAAASKQSMHAGTHFTNLGRMES